MEPYAPGEQPRAGGFIKLNTNENPYPPSPRALDAMRKALSERLRLYPDPMAGRVREAAARLYGVQPGNVLVGNGSDDLLAMIVRACTSPGEAIAFPWPTYTLYETLVTIQGARSLKFDYPPDYSLPEGLAQADARAIIVCNPNSPTGTMAQPRDIEQMVKRAKCLVVVDEAYADFAETNCVALAGALDNVVVLRTLSKGFSLCGIRCGVALASKGIIETLAKVKDSYNVSSVTIAGAEAAFDDARWAADNAEKVKATRERLAAQLRAMDFDVLPSQANFLWAEPRATDAKTIYVKLKERRILVRYFPRGRLRKGLRITVGTDEETDALLRAIRDILQEA